MDGEVALGDHDNTADPLRSETMEHRVDLSGSRFACSVEQESANLVWVVEVLTRTVIDLQHEVPTQDTMDVGS